VGSNPTPSASDLICVAVLRRRRRDMGILLVPRCKIVGDQKQLVAGRLFELCR
jgi:hypothetical protein